MYDYNQRGRGERREYIRAEETCTQAGSVSCVWCINWGQVECVIGTTPFVLDHECFDRATEAENLWDHLHVTSPGE